VRCMEAITQFEEILGLPVVTSNQAVLWECLRMIGVRCGDPRLGRLFARDDASSLKHPIAERETD
jgi:maleate isomerase